MSFRLIGWRRTRQLVTCKCLVLSLRGAVATKQSIFPYSPWIASLCSQWHGRACRAPHHEGLSLPKRFPHLRLDLRHTRYPAVVILGFVAHITENLRMRQDDECLLLDSLQRILRDLLRRKIAVAGLRAFRDRPQHVGIDALRAQDGNADAVGLVRDRKVLRKPNGRMLGRRIGRASDLREQTGGGNRVEKIPLPARLHAW